MGSLLSSLEKHGVQSKECTEIIVNYCFSKSLAFFALFLVRDANTGHANNSWRSSDPVDHDMETELNSSGFKPEVEMLTSNPLYESLGLSTDPDVSQVVANPLYGSDNLTGMSGACVIANPLCNSACTLPGADSAPAIENPLYEATSCIEGITGEVNYGENVDEDGSEESFLG